MRVVWSEIAGLCAARKRPAKELAGQSSPAVAVCCKNRRREGILILRACTILHLPNEGSRHGTSRFHSRSCRSPYCTCFGVVCTNKHAFIEGRVQRPVCDWNSAGFSKRKRVQCSGTR